MRRYDDPVEVRRGFEELEDGGAGDGRPEQFLWRDRLWKVRAVLAHWVETGAWWQADGGTVSDLLAERELWRVEAGRGAAASGVFDLAFSWTDGGWRLVGCTD